MTKMTEIENQSKNGGSEVDENLEIPEHSPDFLKPPESKPEVKEVTEGWMPALNPTQLKIFNDTAKFVLAYGERGSGKTISCLHSCVRHAYDNENALVIIAALTVRVAEKGVLYELENFILPIWRDGNRHPEYLDGQPHPQAGELFDNGISLQFTPSRMDPSTKDSLLWIANRAGGWSCIMLISMPYAHVIEARIKGLSPSMVYVEELVEGKTDDYFRHPAAQLGRRRGMKGAPQQYYASCNPAGPSHWVYKTFIQDPIDEETGRRDPAFSVHHVPMSENIKHLPPGYADQLQKAYKNPIEKRRMIDGEWIDVPDGTGIFSNFFSMELHVKGDALRGIGVMPIKGLPVCCSWDTGPVNLCVTLSQRIVTKNKSFWLTIDCISFVGTYTPYHKAIPIILKRLDYWNAMAGAPLKYIHVSDESAFTTFRTDGSYDSAEIERLGNGRIKLRPCPKGKDTVRERITMLIGMLLEEELFISATADPVIQMFLNILSKKEKHGEYDANAGFKPVRSKHLHVLDSLSYGLFYFHLQPGKLSSVQMDKVSQIAYAAGRG